MKFGRLYIDCPSGYRRFDPIPSYGIEGAEVFPSCVEHLDLAMQRVPGVEPLATITAPPALARESSKKLEIVEDRRLRYRFCHSTACIISKQPARGLARVRHRP